jgi:mRNA-degrading endonuclease toxin of MazEF toxin-antitoxin module
MKAILMQLDDGLAAALDRVAPPAKRQRAEFVRARWSKPFLRPRKNERAPLTSGCGLGGGSRQLVQRGAFREMTQYEIWWADLPQPAGRRPVLLLGRPTAYGYLNKFVAAEVTSTVRGIAQEVPLGRAEGLSENCAASMDNLRTVSREALVKRAGVLAAAKRFEAKRAMGFAPAWDELM